MRRFSIRVTLVVAVAMLSAVPRSAEAVPPDRLDSYRVLSGVSTFRQTGGFAGVANEYQLSGVYDFVQEWSGGTPTDPLEQTARFDNADLRAPLGELLPAFIDVDETLSLESLRGELLPQPLAFTPFEVFRFEGIINDGAPASPLESSTIELFAVRRGPWMYLRGETTPRPWMADFFEYELRALARTGGWADQNEDGRIDAVDYTMMRDAALTAADAIDSHNLWADQFGEQAPDLALFEGAIATALSQQSPAVSVPEPGGLLLIALVAMPALRSRRSSCRL